MGCIDINSNDRPGGWEFNCSNAAWFGVPGSKLCPQITAAVVMSPLYPAHYIPPFFPVLRFGQTGCFQDWLSREQEERPGGPTPRSGPLPILKPPR